MHRKGSKKSYRNLALFAAASAAALTTSHAKAQDLLTQASTGGEQIGRTSSFGGNSFVDIYGSGSTNASFAVFDFNTSGLISPTQEVSTVDNDLTLNLFDSAFSGNITSVNLDLYLITDTSTSLTSSTLKYVTNGTLPGGPDGDGIAATGATGGFAAGTTNYLLGSNTYTYISTGVNGSAEGPYVISLTAAEETYIQNQINAGSDVRIGIATTSTANKSASYQGYAVTSPPNSFPTLNFDTTVTTIGGSNNTSVLTLVNAADGNGKSNDTSPFNFGRVLAGQAATTQTFTLENTSALGTDTLAYRAVQGSPSLSATVTGTDPLGSLQSTRITVGFAGTNTANQAGNDITGSVQFENLNNTNDADATINAIAHVVTTRFLDTAPSTGGTSPSAGEVLIGATATVPMTMFTTDPVGGALGDYTSNSLTTQTLIANGVATGFNATTQYVSGTSVTYAALGAFSPNFNQTWSGANSNQFSDTGPSIVNFTVKALHSGSYGVYNNGGTNTFTVGTRSISIGSQFVAFGTAGVNIAGENLTGESDSARAYGQWSGWQAAALSNSTTSAAGTTNGASIGNADSNDAVYTGVVSGVTNTYNYGLRASAGVTAIAFNQGGWNQSGFTPGTLAADGVTLTGGTIFAAHNTSAAVGTTNSQSATVGLNSTNDINGTYTASMLVTMENVDQADQIYNGTTTNTTTGVLAGIVGTSANDLGVTAVPLTGTVLTPGGTVRGPYSLSGGTLVTNPTSTLMGSYSQTGGTSTFSSAIGTIGTPATSVVLAAGSSTLALGSGTSRMVSLSIGPTAKLDIKDNVVVVTGTSAAAGNAAFGWAGAIGTGYNAAAFNGNGIDSSQVAAKNAAHTNAHLYAVAYAWTGDANVATTLAPIYGNSSVVIEPAIVGDANMDGVVNYTDFQILSANINVPNSNWDQANFNGGPSTSYIDFQLLSANFNDSTSLDSAEFNTMNGFAEKYGDTLVANSDGTGFTLVAVPEPASLGILGFASFGLLARRRRRNSQV